MELDKIIKAWECCTDEIGVDDCDKCPYVESRYDGCMFIMTKDTIDLLKWYKEHEHDVCVNCPIGKDDDVVD